MVVIKQKSKIQKPIRKDQKVGSPFMYCASQFFFFNLTQAVVTWEERTSIKKTLLLDCPEGKYLGCFLD